MILFYIQDELIKCKIDIYLRVRNKWKFISKLITF